MKFKKLFNALIVAVLAVLVIATPIVAQTYYADILVAETDDNAYDMLGLRQQLGVTYLANESYISATGLDTRVMEGGTALPHMLADDKVTFANDLPANSSQTLQFTVGNTDLVPPNFPIITGYDGYLTVNDVENLELGNNFEVEIDGWIDTTAGSNKNLVYKEGAFCIFVSDTEEISSGMTMAAPVTFNCDAASAGLKYFNMDYATCQANAVCDFVQENKGVGQQITFFIYREAVIIDTSALPDDCIIGKAELRVVSSADNSTADFNVVIQNGMPTYPHNPVVIGDYNQAHYSGNGGELTTVGWTAVGNNDIPLNSTGISWINKTGWTKFILRSSEDIAASQPVGDEYIIMTSNSTSLRVWYVDPMVTAPGVDSDEHKIVVTATGGGTNLLAIDVDNGAITDNDPLGGASVPANDNDYIIGQNNTLPYINTLTIDVGGVEVLEFLPDTIINACIDRVRATADAGSTTTLDDAFLVEDDDYWNDYVLEIMTTTDGLAPEGEIRTVTDFDAGNDRLIFGAMTDVVGVGDTYELRSFVIVDETPDSGTADDGKVDELEDAVLNEVDDYWNGATLYIVTTTDGEAPQGEYAIVEDFDDASDTLDFSSFPFSDKVEAGDTYVLRNDGHITWGNNPSGVTCSIESMIPYDGVIGAEPLPTPDVAGEIAEPDTMFPEATALEGTGLAWLYPTVRDTMALTNTPIYLAWAFLAVVFFLVVMAATYKYTQHLALTGLMGVIAIGMLVGMSFLPLWIVFLAVIIVAGVAVSERSPSI